MAANRGAWRGWAMSPSMACETQAGAAIGLVSKPAHTAENDANSTYRRPGTRVVWNAHAVSEPVLYAERDDIAIITINRPEKKNTLTEDVIPGDRRRHRRGDQIR